MDAAAQKIVRAYAKGIDSLTADECLDTGFTENQCDVLLRVLAWRPAIQDNSEITASEREDLKKAGFTDEFIKDVAGDDGLYALKKRVEWLAPNIRKKMWPFGFSDLERDQMITELGKAGALSKKAVPDIIEVLLEKKHARGSAAVALGHIGDERAVPALAKILRSEEPDDDKGFGWVQYYAVGALGRIGTPAVPTLIDLLNERMPFSAEIAVWLRNIGDRRALPALLGAIGSNDSHISHWATEAVIKIGNPDMLWLINALENPDNANLCIGAARILAEIDTGFSFMALPILDNIAEGHGNPACQAEAKKAQEKILEKTF